jgi:hypothetical protein
MATAAWDFTGSRVIVTGAAAGTGQAVRKEWSNPIPPGRLQAPVDVANGVLFPASGAASEITGEALNVTGGLATW